MQRLIEFFHVEKLADARGAELVREGYEVMVFTVYGVASNHWLNEFYVGNKKDKSNNYIVFAVK